MPSRHNFRIDLTSNKPIAKLATHVATDQPYNLPNFDLDLGAPDYSTTLHSVPQLSPLPTSWSSPDDVLGGERERTESFFGGLYASQSVGELQDTLITQPYTSAWNSADATPYRDNNPTNLAVPAGKRFGASISERHLENSSGTDITKGTHFPSCPVLCLSLSISVVVSDKFVLYLYLSQQRLSRLAPPVTAKLTRLPIKPLHTR